MSLPKTICILPWISIETTPSGATRPCCLALDEITDENSNVYKLKETSLEDIYHSEYMQNLRKEFLSGNKPGTCQRCWSEEDAGRTSKRMNSEAKFRRISHLVDWENLNPNQLWFLDLKLGNICNLKCRICGSWSSSKWAKEEIDYVPNINRKDHLAYTFLKDGAWPRESTIFWDNLKQLLPQVKYFEFTGGEPFLIQQHFDLLQYAVDQGLSSEIDIHYNTNGTVFPDDAPEIWSKFKNVEIAFSIDNIGQRFEYERYGAKWNEVQKNVIKFNLLRSNKLSTQLCLTVNIQNVYYLPEICDWILTQDFNRLYFNMLHDPWHMNIAYLTPTAKEVVIKRLQEYNFNQEHKVEIDRIVQFIINGPGSDGDKFRKNMQQTDEYRNQSFLDTHYEIAKAMGYE